MIDRRNCCPVDKLIVGDEPAFLKRTRAGLQANQCAICAMTGRRAARCQRMKWCVFLMDNNRPVDRTYNCAPDRSCVASTSETVPVLN